MTKYDVLMMIEKLTKQDDINQLENALYNIKAIADNDLNAEYWRAFINCLDIIATINLNIFKLLSGKIYCFLGYRGNE